MAQEQFMVLNMPFDEAEGAKKTYDYSPNRADGVVTDASFEAGRQSNCIRFDGAGKCEVQKTYWIWHVILRFARGLSCTLLAINLSLYLTTMGLTSCTKRA